jgi:hypothetical protein
VKKMAQPRVYNWFIILFLKICNFTIASAIV